MAPPSSECLTTRPWLTSSFRFRCIVRWEMALNWLTISLVLAWWLCWINLSISSRTWLAFLALSGKRTGRGIISFSSLAGLILASLVGLIFWIIDSLSFKSNSRQASSCSWSPRLRCSSWAKNSRSDSTDWRRESAWPEALMKFLKRLPNRKRSSQPKKRLSLKRTSFWRSLKTLKRPSSQLTLTNWSPILKAY